MQKKNGSYSRFEIFFIYLTFEIINYGSGKEPALETIDDAGEPLEIRWYNDSYIEIPVRNE
ncbi:MAG TPA: hypothetical protein VJ951_01015 [Bacteroidales bacterium]|nr:hypothetical protein [Bacteroidales bacterium]